MIIILWNTGGDNVVRFEQHRKHFDSLIEAETFWFKLRKDENNWALEMLQVLRRS